MTKFYFPHVQMVLKITSSAVQIRFSRLEQSLSWIFMKSAVIKITAYWGRTPPQKSDRRCIHNHFWPTFKRKVFKIGGKLYNSADSDFDPRPEISCYGPVWGGISKKIFDQQVPGNIPGK